MVLLTVSGSLDSLRPPAWKERPCVEANGGQNAFLLCALGLIALGTGGIKPCVSSFGADQYDEAHEKEAIQKYVFFNWFFFAINMGAIFGITVLVYIQEQKGWSVGLIRNPHCLHNLLHYNSSCWISLLPLSKAHRKPLNKICSCYCFFCEEPFWGSGSGTWRWPLWGYD